MNQHQKSERLAFWWSTSFAITLCTLFIMYFATYWSSGYLQHLRNVGAQSNAAACISEYQLLIVDDVPKRDFKRAALATCLEVIGAKP